MSLRKAAVLSGAISLFVSQMAMSVGLGEIKLNSSLNEPLDAEIELLNVGELSDLEMLVGLASRDDFERAGVAREFFLTDLQFAVDLSGNRKVIRVKSRKPVREPYLDFLVELQWPAGRLLREYTMLVDLPVFASEGGSAKKPQAKSVQAASAAPAARPTPAAEQPARSSRPSQSFADGNEYRVENGDSLWSIARRSRPEGASLPQTINAIHGMNPHAFINGDINLLKRGEVLRLPDRQQATNTSHSEGVAKIQQGNRQLLDRQDAEADQAESEGPLLDAVTEQQPVEQTEQAPAGRLKLAVADPEAASAEATDLSTALESNTDAVGAGEPGREALENNLTVAAEELERKSRELEDMQARNALLEEQLATMQRMLEIQDADMSAVQVAAANANAEQADAAPASVSAQAQAAEKAEAEATPAQAAAKASTSASTNAGKPSGEGFWQTYRNYLIAFGALLVALIVFLFRRRKNADDNGFDDEHVEPVMATPDPVVAPVVAQEPPASQEVELEEDDELFGVPPMSAAEQVARDEAQNDAVDHLPTIEDDLLAEVDESASEEPDLQGFDGAISEGSSSEESLADDNSLEFDLDLDLDDVSLDDLSTEAVTDTEESDGVGDFSLELGDDLISESTDNQPELDTEEADSNDEFDLLADADEVSTKLDLAKAYVDMGDAQGAREILEEVLSEGNAEQQESARQLLEGLS